MKSSGLVSRFGSFQDRDIELDFKTLIKSNSAIRVEDLGFRVQGSGFGVQHLGLGLGI